VFLPVNTEIAFVQKYPFVLLMYYDRCAVIVGSYVYDRDDVTEDSTQSNNEVCKLVSVLGCTKYVM